MRTKFRAAVVAASVGLVTGLTGAGVASAAAAAPAGSCDGAGCTGRDPIAAGCTADAYTPPGAAVDTFEGVIELRYSPSCHANWARITRSRPGAWLWVQNEAGDARQMYVPAGSTTGYTDMVNGYPRARAGGRGGHTGWF